MSSDLNDALTLPAQEAIAQAVRLALREYATPAQEWLNTAQAARYVGFSVQKLTIARCRRDGSGPKYSKHTKSVRYRRAWLDEWMEKGLVDDQPLQRPKRRRTKAAR